MLAGINITCFAASYAIALGLEVSRLFFRAPVRWIVMIAFCVAGLLAHTLFLWNVASGELRGGAALLASWHDWCMVASWLVAAAYLGLAIRRPQNSVGLFILPIALALIAAGAALHDSVPFPPSQALRVWRTVHGVALLLGTVSVSLGFAAGLMYLAQAYRLKHKLPARPGFRLPTLEWLQRFNRESLFLSTALLAGGLLSGVVLNVSDDGRSVSWLSSGVLFSAVLFAWMMAAMFFEFFYRPAREGRKVAYLTFASFVFLAIALASIWLSNHGANDGTRNDDSTGGEPSSVQIAPNDGMTNLALLNGDPVSSIHIWNRTDRIRNAFDRFAEGASR